MRCGRIPDGDKLFRHSVRPNGFKKDAFSPRNLFRLYDQDDGSVLASVAWQRLFPTDQHVHDYGCRLAAKQNEGLVEKDRLSEKTRRIYCGAYQLTARSVRALVGTPNLEEIASSNVTHHPEDGEIAHIDLAIRINANPVNIETTKTAILDRLWAASCGPLKHVCECDADLVPHPNSTLVDGPAGACEDNRRAYLRRWRIARLNLCTLFYRIERLAAHLLSAT
jgi:hypothetical protein